jgi:hypothetical protein
MARTGVVHARRRKVVDDRSCDLHGLFDLHFHFVNINYFLCAN